uniref:coproporphyrinogen oxidase n=1 Tax=Rhodosorus marinus TaxID=101924 RepID=A0A7S2ZPF4_9RHOD|mmetsp:Transcript_27404/g.107229  ORF Transcript_27404/g.107229 Transcript_27404/m.107229 type:complete len:380 (+) Transcript_27404:210-1349(+)
MVGFVVSFGCSPARRMESNVQLKPGFRSRSAVNMVAADQAKSDADSKRGSLWDHQYVTELPESLVTGSGDKDPSSMRARFERMIRKAQDDLCKAIEEVDGEGTFIEDAWVRENGGGGISRVLQKGKVFEKAGINISVVYGEMPPEAVKAASDRGVTRDAGYKDGEVVPFFACGISSVMHPRNPMAPTVHFNYRYFETDSGLYWFGGGTDLTPSYLYEEDAKHFHQTLKDVCDRHDEAYYPKFKKWCDDYFLIKHRGERRGIGGIFFDDLNEGDQDAIFAFSTDLANNVANAYVPIVNKRKDEPFTEEQKQWQQMRRGRYVEFNLVYDRGTIFGLKTGGRIESILMSLPETATWLYNFHPEEGTWEAKTLEVMKNPPDWV